LCSPALDAAICGRGIIWIAKFAKCIAAVVVRRWPRPIWPRRSSRLEGNRQILVKIWCAPPAFARGAWLSRSSDPAMDVPPASWRRSAAGVVRLASRLWTLGPFLLIDTCGPFQTADHRIAGARRLRKYQRRAFGVVGFMLRYFLNVACRCTGTPAGCQCGARGLWADTDFSSGRRCGNRSRRH